MTMNYETLLAQERPGVLRFGGARMAILDVEAGFWALRRQMEMLVGSRLTEDVLQQAGANGGASFAQAFAGGDVEQDIAQSLRDCIAAYQAAGFGQFEIVESSWPFGTTQGRPRGRVLIRARDAFEAWATRQHSGQASAPVCAYTAGVLVGFVNVLAGRQDVVCIQRACQGEGAEACLFELLPADAAGDARVVAFDPDPALGRQLNLLELLFDRMPMGIAIFDREYRIRRYNPTWAEFAELYAPPSAVPIAPGVCYFDFLPGTEPTVMPLFEQALAGETIRREAVRLESEGIVTYWDVVLAPVFEGEEVTGILNVTIDATGRVQANRKLERTLETLRRREERLALVMAGINDGVWDWDIESGEIYFSPRWKSMLGYTEDEVPDEFESWQQLIHPDDRERAVTALQQHLDGKMEVYRLEHRLLHKDGTYRWILARGKALRHDDGTPYRLVGSHTDVSERVMAQQNLEQRVEERTQELAILLRVSQDVNAMLELQPLLDLILDQLKTVVEYTGSSILTLEDGDLTVRAYRGPIPETRALQLRFALDGAQVNRQVIQQREPIIIPDIRSDMPLANMFRNTAGGELESTFGYVRSWLGVPLMVKGEVLGMLTLDHSEPDHFSTHHADLVQTFANQAAVAIENARSYEAEQEQLLESERRRQVAEGLRDILTVLNSDLPLETILDHIVAQAARLLGAQGGAVYHLRHDHGQLLIEAGYELPDDLKTIGQIPVYRGGAVEQMVNQKPYVIPDIREHLAHLDPDAMPLAPPFVQWLESIRRHYQAYLGVPLVIADEVYGSLGLYYQKAQDFDEEEIELGMTLANQAALAIQNARLQQAERDRQRELQTLLAITETASRSLDLEEMLSATLDHLVALVGASRAGVVLPEATSGDLVLRMIRPERSIDGTDLAELIQACAQVVADGRPLYVEQPEPGALLPLRVRGQVLGVLGIVGYEGSPFSSDQLALFGSIADQLAVAVENSWLYQQAEESAATAERTRLARDLHDAVTQTLFSSSLIAEVLPRLWERNPEEGRRRLTELRELTRGALAEMRTLLLELRPSALVEAKLSDLLRQLAESITGRARVPVHLEIEGECDLDAEVKVALYRIAQEALNNVAKHAGAAEATVRLHCQPGRVELYVADDGSGFDPDTLPPDSLGLGIMRERAEGIGASLEVESRVGQGTEVRTVWTAHHGR